MGLGFTIQHSGLQLLEPGNHPLEGAVLSLLFFAVSLALPINSFLTGTPGARSRPLSLTCVAAAVYSLSASSLGAMLVSSSIIWPYFSLIALCFIPAGLCRFILEAFPVDAAALRLSPMTNLLVVFTVSALLGVAANVASAEFFLSIFFILLTIALFQMLLVFIRVIRTGTGSAEPVLLGLVAMLITGLAPAVAAALHLSLPLAFPVLWGLLLFSASLLGLLRLPKPAIPAKSRSTPAAAGCEEVPAQDTGHWQDNISGFTHEINHPLGTGLLAATHLQQELNHLQDLFHSGELKKSDLEKGLYTYKEAADIITTNLQDATELVRAFNQSGTAGSSAGKQVFNVASHCRQVLQGLMPRIRQAGHQLHYTCLENITINSYPLFFSQIISNLIINSLTHAYPAGTAGILSLEITTGPDTIQLQYADDGKGIDQEHLSQIFKPHFTTNASAGNTGQGLSIVHTLVTQRLGGTIDCASTSGKGTAFTIILPIERR